MSIENKFLKVTMPDRSKWKIPVRVIAEHRARYYSGKQHISFEESLKNTLECFEEDDSDVEDWATNNMDWTDVEKYALKLKDVGMSYEDFQEGWINGEKEIVEE